MAGHLIVACWIIFMLYWFVSARSVKATVERQSLASELAYRLPILAGWLLLVLDRLPGPLDQAVLPHRAVIKLSGVAICVLGLLVAVWARKTLADNWSSTVVFKQNHELVERGPYRFARHPIYTGILLMFLGTVIAANRAAGFAALVFCFVGFWIKLKQEEKLMLRHFSNEYPAYQARVKALVPYVL